MSSEKTKVKLTLAMRVVLNNLVTVTYGIEGRGVGFDLALKTHVVGQSLDFIGAMSKAEAEQKRYEKDRVEYMKNHAAYERGEITEKPELKPFSLAEEGEYEIPTSALEWLRNLVKNCKEGLTGTPDTIVNMAIRLGIDLSDLEVDAEAK